MNEFELIDMLTRGLPSDSSVITGPGDDCAVIDATGSTSVSSGGFTLTVQGASPDTIGMFFYGGDEMQYPFGNDAVAGSDVIAYGLP